ncbi:hypothetical protein ABVK25_006247 [Lepraria finkii]|uniref:J domain-containing protein n=1 Tax=Lepraria finkii TaxID=1340010 RepID=A0ABR4B6V4_9LECA
MDDPPTTNPYQILNVPKDATLATIRSAHRKLVLSCHPDKVQDPTEKLVKAEQFHEVQKAYETLSDERKRQRYDESVKLAELRKEMMNEKCIPRRTDDYFGPPRGGASPKFETYDNGVRYQRAEPPSSGRYERDTYAAEYPEDRTPWRKYDDRYTPTSRRSFGRVPEDKRKTRETEDERERDRRRKVNDRDAYNRDSRRRDKDRRKDSEMKSSKKFAYVGEEESDSEVDNKYYKFKREPLPKPKYEDVRRRSVDDPPRKSSKREGREYDDSELESKTAAIKEYMNKSREAIEPEPSRRPARARASSKLDARTPPLPPRPTAEPERRSSGRARGGSRALSPTRSSKKDRRTPEIVDSPSSRKASVPGGSSFTKAMKGVINPASSSRSGTQRSAMYQATTEFRPKPLQRSETMPVDRMHRGERGESRPLQSSNPKNMKAPSDYSDSSLSESDSEMTEDILPIRPRLNPRQTSTRYQYIGDDAHYVLEPEEIQPRKSDEIYSSRRASERPQMPRGSTTRAPPTGRSMSHIYTPEDRSPHQNYSRTESARAPPLKTHQSAHNSPRLFGEYAAPDEVSPRSKHSPRIYADEVRSARRGSGDVVDKDAWPGKFKTRPHMARGETTAN